ncbi:hypothetical protein RRX38_05005 [Pseudomonas sp. DTU_2021_1001937_2_SI_NGA_ILE_001]|uniref:hypothetical protein n=1 Tax=Pseudomonas sp. DTU_2021_1001937_2_SI_NGA_ILE_001 TaxID=3077589 RepID=UPI0025D80D50|nr:hypothetical protein [Pseudomonas sp. DTU_2021_1001937_2_SI_NGA_ILE_001]WNW10537.1 hypothetical protein RRX38_05005 [Pseudomonas sp. DTU_2021_1001937_2_SI_NGA_ILE_001]
MLRYVVSHLSQWLKRFSSEQDPRHHADKRYARDFTREQEREASWSLSSILLVVALSAYCLGGLGYYAKTHIWDTMSEAQKEQMAQAMIVSAQNL